MARTVSITKSEIRTTMYNLYQAWIERNDDSYFELLNSFRTLRSLNLISDETWNMIFEYDRHLVKKFECGVIA